MTMATYYKLLPHQNIVIMCLKIMRNKKKREKKSPNALRGHLSFTLCLGVPACQPSVMRKR